jgi:TRAP-type C4-dicarboxylate transport system permease small subunit
MLRLLNRVAWLFAIVGGVVAVATALMVVASIVGRATMAAPIQGDVEITQFAIALTISLCLPWCQLHGGNIMVDFFTQRLGERPLRVLDAFGALMLALMAALLSWRAAVGAVGSKDTFEATMILGLPMWWTYASLAPGLALAALVALVQVVLHLRGRGMEALRA